MESRDGDTVESKRTLQGDYGKESEPNAAAEKIKWHNRRDEAYGLLCFIAVLVILSVKDHNNASLMLKN